MCAPRGAVGRAGASRWVGRLSLAVTGSPALGRSVSRAQRARFLAANQKVLMAPSPAPRRASTQRPAPNPAAGHRAAGGNRGGGAGGSGAGVGAAAGEAGPGRVGWGGPCAGVRSQAADKSSGPRAVQRAAQHVRARRRGCARARARAVRAGGREGRGAGGLRADWRAAWPPEPR